MKEKSYKIVLHVGLERRKFYNQEKINEFILLVNRI